MFNIGNDSNHGQFEELANETLFELRQSSDGCFVSNLAGLELINCPDAALSSIERVIRDTVDEAAAKGAFSRSDFHGVTYLIGAYLLISARSGCRDTGRFLNGLTPTVQIEVLGAIRTFFQRKGDGYNFNVSPPTQFREFVQKLTESESDELRLAAQRTLNWVVWDK